MTDTTATIQVYRVYIKATPEAIWQAITSPEWTDRYGYGGRGEYELKAGGRYCHKASADMTAMGLPEDLIVGEVIEADPPRKLVQTWHPRWTEESIAEKPTRLTYEIVQGSGGVCILTLTHDVAGAPSVARMVPGGGDAAQGGGGWPWVLSDLKSLLETGKRMAA
jgi:uncharacterized protein YndB with AHSA1/START domain